MLNVYINCRSILLQRSLEIFLKNYKTSYKDCELVISDRKVKTNKPLLIIGEKGGIEKPFTKNQLLFVLDKKREELGQRDQMKNSNLKESAMEIEIEKLALRFAKDLVNILQKKDS